MPLISDVTICGKCKYYKAIKEYDTDIFQEWIKCQRCGYCWDREYNKKLGKYIIRKGGGKGVYCYTYKNKRFGAFIETVWGPLKSKEKYIEWFKKNRRKFSEARMTTEENGGWVETCLFTGNKQLIRNNFHVLDEGDK